MKNVTKLKIIYLLLLICLIINFAEAITSITDKKFCYDEPSMPYGECTESNGYYDALAKVWTYFRTWGVTHKGCVYLVYKSTITFPSGNKYSDPNETEYNCNGNYPWYAWWWWWQGGNGPKADAWIPGSYDVYYYFEDKLDRTSKGTTFSWTVNGLTIKDIYTCKSKPSGDSCNINSGHYKVTDTVYLFWRTWWIDHNRCHDVTVDYYVKTPSGQIWNYDSYNGYKCEGQYDYWWWWWSFSPPNKWKPGTYTAYFTITDNRIGYSKQFSISWTIDTPDCSYLNGCNGNNQLRSNCKYDADVEDCICETYNLPGDGYYCADSVKREYRDYTKCSNGKWMYNVISTENCENYNSIKNSKKICNGDTLTQVDTYNIYQCSNGDNNYPNAKCVYTTKQVSSPIQNCNVGDGNYCSSLGNIEFRDYKCITSETAECGFTSNLIKKCDIGCIYKNNNPICKALNILGVITTTNAMINDVANITINYTSIGYSGDTKFLVSLSNQTDTTRIFLSNVTANADSSIVIPYKVPITAKEGKQSFKIEVQNISGYTLANMTGNINISGYAKMGLITATPNENYAGRTETIDIPYTSYGLNRNISISIDLGYCYSMGNITCNYRIQNYSNCFTRSSTGEILPTPCKSIKYVNLSDKCYTCTKFVKNYTYNFSTDINLGDNGLTVDVPLSENLTEGNYTFYVKLLDKGLMDAKLSNSIIIFDKYHNEKIGFYPTEGSKQGDNTNKNSKIAITTIAIVSTLTTVTSTTIVIQIRKYNKNESNSLKTLSDSINNIDRVVSNVIKDNSKEFKDKNEPVFRDSVPVVIPKSEHYSVAQPKGSFNGIEHISGGYYDNKKYESIGKVPSPSYPPYSELPGYHKPGWSPNDPYPSEAYDLINNWIEYYFNLGYSTDNIIKLVTKKYSQVSTSYIQSIINKLNDKKTREIKNEQMNYKAGSDTTLPATDEKLNLLYSLPIIGNFAFLYDVATGKTKIEGDNWLYAIPIAGSLKYIWDTAPPKVKGAISDIITFTNNGLLGIIKGVWNAGSEIVNWIFKHPLETLGIVVGVALSAIVIGPAIAGILETTVVVIGGVTITVGTLLGIIGVGIMIWALAKTFFSCGSDPNSQACYNDGVESGSWVITSIAGETFFIIGGTIFKGIQLLKIANKLKALGYTDEEIKIMLNLAKVKELKESQMLSNTEGIPKLLGYSPEDFKFLVRLCKELNLPYTTIFESSTPLLKLKNADYTTNEILTIINEADNLANLNKFVDNLVELRPLIKKGYSIEDLIRIAKKFKNSPDAIDLIIKLKLTVKKDDIINFLSKLDKEDIKFLSQLNSKRKLDNEFFLALEEFGDASLIKKLRRSNDAVLEANKFTKTWKSLGEIEKEIYRKYFDSIDDKYFQILFKLDAKRALRLLEKIKKIGLKFEFEDIGEFSKDDFNVFETIITKMEKHKDYLIRKFKLKPDDLEKIVIKPLGKEREYAHYDNKKKQIVFNLSLFREIYSKGDEFIEFLILHEVGHIESIKYDKTIKQQLVRYVESIKPNVIKKQLIKHIKSIKLDKKIEQRLIEYVENIKYDKEIEQRLIEYVENIKLDKKIEQRLIRYIENIKYDKEIEQRLIEITNGARNQAHDLVVYKFYKNLAEKGGDNVAKLYLDLNKRYCIERIEVGINILKEGKDLNSIKAIFEDEENYPFLAEWLIVDEEAGGIIKNLENIAGNSIREGLEIVNNLRNDYLEIINNVKFE